MRDAKRRHPYRGVAASLCVGAVGAQRVVHRGMYETLVIHRGTRRARVIHRVGRSA